MKNIKKILSVTSGCLACGYSFATSMFSDKQPLSTIGWPKNKEEAKSMQNLELEFVRCIDCGHVYNLAFEYDNVPYTEKPNLMFNSGKHWSGFIKSILEKIILKLPEKPTVIEVGYGDGSFLSELANTIGKGNFIGFDPHGAYSNLSNVELRQEIFNPLEDMPKISPDLIVSRHVLEHMTRPLEFLQSISHANSVCNRTCLAYLEVPCIDNVLKTGRTVDLYYEHNSQFTTKSFKRMIKRSRPKSAKIGHGYNKEVIYALLTLKPIKRQERNIKEALGYKKFTEQSYEKISSQLDEMLKKSIKVAVWGGVGKSASFLNRYNMTSSKFPIVVDSDLSKVGTFVPGTGQEILFRDHLKSNPVEIIIIPPQWRAYDIVNEILDQNISFDKILIEDRGKLIDFLSDNHSYPKIL